MPTDIPAIRILPMSSQIKGFRRRSIEDVQAGLFLRDLPKCNGRWRYASAGLNAAAGTVVLFQFRARIIASAVFLRDERFDRPRRGYGGVMYFDPKSIRTFDPLNLEAMRKIWPALRAFGHVKQFLNPTRYSAFRRWLKRVSSAPIRAIVDAGPARWACMLSHIIFSGFCLTPNRLAGNLWARDWRKGDSSSL